MAYGSGGHLKQRPRGVRRDEKCLVTGAWGVCGALAEGRGLQESKGARSFECT